MKINQNLFNIMIIASLLMPASGSAFFMDQAKGVRPAGMGEAFVAVADDANTVLYNPAGFSRLCRLELAGMFADLYSGMEPLLYTGGRDRIGYNFLSAAIPVTPSVGTFGLSWVQLNTTFYDENVFTFSYARRLYQPLKLDVGTNVKLLSWGIEGSDFTADMLRRNLTLDLGLLATFGNYLNAGLSLENIIPGDLGVDDKDHSPLNLRAGLSAKFRLHHGYIDSVQPQLELVMRDVNYENGDFNIKGGVETRHFNHLLALRLGVNMEVFSTGFSFHFEPMEKPLSLEFDYAFSYPFYIKYNSGSHRVGMIIRYGDCRPPAHTPTVTPTATATATPTATAAAAEELEEKLVEVQKKIDLGELKPIYFDTGKSTIKNISYPTLDFLGNIIVSYPQIRIAIDGHTDDRGSADYNKKLSQSRVDAAKQYLVEHFGIDDKAIVSTGYGEEQPIADNTTADGRAKNRRVEFHVVKEGKKSTTFTVTEPAAVTATSTPVPVITPTAMPSITATPGSRAE